MRFLLGFLSVFSLALLCSHSAFALDVSPCKVVTLQAQKSGIKTQGVGSLFEKDGKIAVFTLAHIIDGADTISARCGSETQDLRIRKIHRLKDFALLDFISPPPKTFTTPLFHVPVRAGEIAITPFQRAWPDWTQDEILFKILTPTGSEVVADGYSLLPADYFDQLDLPGNKLPKTLLSAHGSSIWLDSESDSFPQYKSIIQTFGAAGAPGASGSPLISSSLPNKGFIGGIAGFLAKSERNGFRSIAIPMREALAWLNSPTVDKKIVVTSKIEMRHGKEVWVKYRTLHLTFLNRNYEFHESCPSSHWNPISSGGGGSWGDSGGSDSPLKNPAYSGFPSQATLALTKDMTVCEKEGLNWNDKLIIGYRGTHSRKPFHVIRSIEDLISAIHSDPPVKELSDSFVSSENFSSLGGFSLLCLNTDQFDETMADFSKGWHQEDDSGLTPNFAVHHFLLKKKPRFSLPHFHCEKGWSKKSIPKLVFDSRARNAPFLRLHTIRVPNLGSFSNPFEQNQMFWGRIEFSPHKIEGKIRIEDVVIEINESVNVNHPWSKRIAVAQGTLLIKFDTKDKLFSVTLSPAESPWWLLGFSFFGKSLNSARTPEELIQKVVGSQP